MGDWMRLDIEQIGLLREPHLAYVATINKDGSPQVTPVWVDTDGEAILFNTARGRVKCRNLERDPRMAITVVDADHPQTRTLVARGRARLSEEGALEQIDFLSRKYESKPWVPQPGETRVVVRMIPDRAWAAE
jgi:PPOX class probable F420-dependent enzyme